MALLACLPYVVEHDPTWVVGGHAALACVSFGFWHRTRPPMAETAAPGTSRGTIAALVGLGGWTVGARLVGLIDAGALQAVLFVSWAGTACLGLWFVASAAMRQRADAKALVGRVAACVLHITIGLVALSTMPARETRAPNIYPFY